MLVHTSTTIRLFAVLAAAGWAGSYASAIMVDVAWYNPDIQSWLPLEFLRRCAGLSVAVLFGALTLLAPWPADGRLACAAIAATLVSLQLRVNETDRTLALGDVYAGQRDLVGRRIVTTALHTLVGNPLIHLRRQTARGDQAIFDLVRQVDSGLPGNTRARPRRGRDHGLAKACSLPPAGRDRGPVRDQSVLLMPG